MKDWRTSEKIAFGLVAFCVVGFIALVFSIETSLVNALDESVMRRLRSGDDLDTLIGPHWLHECARDFTALGGYAVLLTLTLLVYGFLRLEKRRAAGLFIVATIVSGYVVSMVLKETIGRPRPEIVKHLSHADSGIGGPSFPSGHSTMSTVVYVTMALMLSGLSSHKRVKVFLLVAPLAIAFVVGASRVMMGVHYPTDVLGGWMVGLAWAVGAWLLMRLRRRHKSLQDQATSESELSTRW